MILLATNGVHKDVDDLYGDHFTVTLARAAATLECAPYWHSGEKAPSRLMRAQELVRHSRVILHDDRRATVHGSTKAYDVTGFHCTCPQSQKGSTHWCVHAVAVKLARTMAAQAPREEALPLPPVTVEERLAQAAADARDHVFDALPTPIDARLAAAITDAQEISQIVAQRLATEAPLAGAHHTPQEDRMSEDEEVYMPEPHDTATAVLAPPETPPATTRPLPGPVLLPSLDAHSLKRSMQEWSAQRQVIRSFLQQELKEGVDFYRLQVRGKDANPTLSKAGAEKFLGLFQLQASFAPDLLTWEMLGKPTDHVIYICTLRTRSGEVVGEGRGSRSLKKDSGDTNKAIKMSEKSALIDAVLRTGALSEVYTQDVEDQQDEPTPAQAQLPAHPNAQQQRSRIWALVQAQAPAVKTREQVGVWIAAETGYALHPDHYGKIIDALEVRA